MTFLREREVFDVFELAFAGSSGADIQHVLELDLGFLGKRCLESERGAESNRAR